MLRVVSVSPLRLEACVSPLRLEASRAAPSWGASGLGARLVLAACSAATVLGCYGHHSDDPDARALDVATPRDAARRDVPVDGDEPRPDADGPGPGAPGTALVGTDILPFEMSGSSVALTHDGARALVGAPYGITAAGMDSPGVTRVFVRAGASWAHEVSLTFPGAPTQVVFGGAVALSADGARALVGAAFDDAIRPRAGSAYVFVRAGADWALEAALPAPNLAEDVRFAAAVALSADASRALVGIPEEPSRTTPGNRGGARVYVRTGTEWTEEARLVDVVPIGGWGNLGAAVALSADGGRAVVGVPRDRTGIYTDEGTARVFVRTGARWSEEAALRPVAPAIGAWFGASAAISSDGSRVLVGAPSDAAVRDGAPTPHRLGTAHVFARTGATWTEEVVLVPAGARNTDHFGTSVSLSADGSRAVVGAPLDDTTAGIERGSARVFVRTGATWRETATLVSPDSMEADWFGTSVAVSADGAWALVGAYMHSSPTRLNDGAAYGFGL